MTTSKSSPPPKQQVVTSKEELMDDLERHVVQLQQQEQGQPSATAGKITKGDRSSGNNKKDDNDDDEEKQRQKDDIKEEQRKGQQEQPQPPQEEQQRGRQGRAAGRTRTVLPGAYAIAGANANIGRSTTIVVGDGLLDRQQEEGGVGDPANTTTAAADGSIPSSSPPLVVTTTTEASIVEEEHVIRERVKARIEERITTSAIEATNVRRISGSNSGGRGGSSSRQLVGRKHRTCFIMMIVGFLIILSVAITLRVVTTTTRNNNNDKEKNDGDNELDKDRHELMSLILSSPVFKESSQYSNDMTTLITDPSTPQYHAFEWLVSDYYDYYGGDNDDDIDPQHVIERYAIATLYYSTTATTTSSSSDWVKAHDFLNSNTSICEWGTVTGGGSGGSGGSAYSAATSNTDNETNVDDDSIIRCDDRNGYITLLNLDNFGLNGTLPMELSSLQYLEELSLALNNELRGTIPSEYGTYLTRLEAFQIVYSSGMTGSIPTTIGNWRKLRSLGILGTSITGTIPNELITLKELETVLLSGNLLTGTIPEFGGSDTSSGGSGSTTTSTSGQSDVRVLVLEQNMLHGTIPQTIYTQLTLLEEIVLMYNMGLTGTLPTELGYLSKLQYFACYLCQLNGTLPTEMGLLRDLWAFDVASNQLTGTMPTELGNLSERMLYLYIHDNKLTGTIPAELGNLSKIRAIFVGYNNLTGIIPSSFATSLPSLEHLNVQNTTLSIDAFDYFCSIDPNVAVSADCGSIGSDGGDTTIATDDDDDSTIEVPCDCCFVCRNDVTGVGTYNAQRACELKSTRYNTLYNIGNNDDNNNSNNIRGSTCECTTTTTATTTDDDGRGGDDDKHKDDEDVEDASTLAKKTNNATILMTCSEEICETCTKDGVVCAKNIEKGFIINDENGRVMETFSKFIYSKGPSHLLNTQVEFRDVITTDDPGFGSAVFDSVCFAYVNGKQCRACNKLECRNGYYSWRVSCDNVLLVEEDEDEDATSTTTSTTASNYDSCYSDPDLNNYDYNALTIFALQDPYLRDGSGCRPWLMDVFEDYNRWE